MDVAAFSQSVQCGLKLAKRIYHGNNRKLLPPETSTTEREVQPSDSFLPSAPMLYAIIHNPAIVDNPDIPSYQPHVHGTCDPPALIPLQMNDISMELDCYIDTVFVSLHGSWRLHCVMASKCCGCRIVVPMGEKGSVLGMEVDVAGKSYATSIRPMEEMGSIERQVKVVGGRFLKAHIFSLIIPQVDGGSVISVKLNWVQHLLFSEGQSSVAVPFNFPEYINSTGRKFASHERIHLNLNAGITKEILCKMTSHPMKEIRKQIGRMAFLYDAQVLTWSNTNFKFSYEVCSNEMFGSLLLQSPSLEDFDQREIFYLYLYPGKSVTRKIFKREVVFLIDVSASMQGKPLENVRMAVSAACSVLNSHDSFNIISFNAEVCMFSSSLQSATGKTLELATKWLNEICAAEGGTSIHKPLFEAMEMFSSACDSYCQIYLITDGAVEDERGICHTVKSHLETQCSAFPHIFTFGLGSYCNHYFLRMLASLTGGHHDAAFDADFINARLKRFFTCTSSPIMCNITIEGIEAKQAFEAYPSQLPSLLFDQPVTIYGRYSGYIPDTIKATGILADMSRATVELRVQHTKDIDLDKITAKQQLELLTAHSWLSESEMLREKILKLSIQKGLASEYSLMILIQNTVDNQKLFREDAVNKNVKKLGVRKMPENHDPKVVVLIYGLTTGFGNLAATSENVPIGSDNTYLRENSAIFPRTVHCPSELYHCSCCFCCLRVCSKMNDQCVLALAQLCTALSCFGCLSCCIDLCCPQVE